MNIRNQTGFTIYELLIVVIAILGIGGWIGNIVRMVDAVQSEAMVEVVVRLVGAIVVPLGAVLGYIPF